ncbi:MAG: type II secretion system protein N [Spirochaetota bacterium]
MLKKIFIMVYVVLGVGALFQASKLIDGLLQKQLINYEPSTHLQRDPALEAVPTQVSYYNPSIAASPLFGIEVGKTTTRTPANAPEASPSYLLRKYQLNGIVLRSEGNSVALIRRAGQRGSKAYSAGDELEGARIVRIKKHSVLLEEKGQMVELPMYYREMAKQNSPGQQTAQPQPQEPEGETADSGSSRQLRKVLSRSDVENRVFNRVNEILTRIAVAPYMVDGNMEGLRLVRVPRDSIVYDLGGRSGDIVKRVNRHPVNQVDQMYRLWENIKDDSMIHVDLERNNQMYTYQFEIRE